MIINRGKSKIAEIEECLYVGSKMVKKKLRTSYVIVKCSIADFLLFVYAQRHHVQILYEKLGRDKNTCH